jgi:hypothetical protein
VLTRRMTRGLLTAGTALAVAALTAVPPAMAAPGQGARHASVAGAGEGAGRAVAAGSPASGAGALSSELAAAWRITEGRGVTIAVLSTGAAPVQSLAGRLISGPDYAPLPNEVKTDGTLIADAIAGSGSTSAGAFGQIGRAPQARILSIRINGSTEPGASRYFKDGVWQRNEARGIMYAAQHGAQVIATDVTGGADSPALLSAVSYAVTRGAVVVVTGPGSAPQYPASLPGVVDVSYIALNGQTAPPKYEKPATASTSILVTTPDNELPVDGPGDTPYLMFNDFAGLAWAAGIAGLIKAKYPHLAPALVVRALAQSARDAPRGGYSTTAGFGLINPLGALHAAGRLASLTRTASSGTVSSSAFLTRGPRLPAIEAVRHSAAKLDLYYALIALGVVLLLLAVVLAVRRPRATAAAVPGQAAV